MYGWPDSLDPIRFVGHVLNELTFTQNTVHLVFDEQLSVTIESCYMHSIDGEVDEGGLTCLPVKRSSLMQLLGESIESAVATKHGALTLNFTNRQKLVCIDDDPLYEAYRVKIGDEEYVI